MRGAVPATAAGAVWVEAVCMRKRLQKCKKPSLQAGRAFHRADEKKPSTVVEGFAVAPVPRTRCEVGSVGGCRDVPLKERQHLGIESLVKSHPVKPCCIAADAGHCLGQRG